MTKPTMINRRTFSSLAAAATLSASFGATKAFAADTDVRIAWTPGPASPQIPMALDKGLFKANGINPISVTFPTGREALEALLNGGAEIASLAELPAVTAAMRNQDFVLLASSTVFSGNRVIFNTSLGVSEVADLQGRKLGVTMGTNMQFLAETVLGAAGVEAEMVNVAPGDMVPALVRGDVDAAVMFDFFYPMAQQALGDSYGEVAAPEYNGQFVICASKEFAENNPEGVVNVLRALIAADELLEDDAETVRVISEATGGALTVETVQAKLPDYKYELAINAELLPLMVQEGEWINRNGVITEPASEALFRSYIADQFIGGIDKERVQLK